MGKPNCRAGVETGNGSGEPKRVEGLLALPWGGKIGARRNRLLTLLECCSV